MDESPTLSSQTIALTGATGRLGSAVVPALLEAGASVTAIVRRTDDTRLPQPVRQVEAALTDASALETALTGADQLVAILPDVPEIPNMMAALNAAASAVGVKRVVKISAHLAGRNPPESFGIEHRVADEVLQASALEAVIYRPAMFMQSLALFFGDWAKGRLIVPVKTGSVAFIDAGDIAAAAVRALEGGIEGGTYTLTGPQSLTFGEVADQLSQWSGTPIKHMAPPRWLAGLIMRMDKSMDAFTRGRLLDLLKALEEGKEATVEADLQQILGRPGRTLHDRLATCRADGGDPPDLNA